MTSISRALVLFSAMALPLLATSVAADAAPARGKGRAAARKPVPAPKPVAASTAIIPLPLQPIVPASQRVCANRTPSGLGYTMLRSAEGAKPGETDTVLIGYIGYLASTGAVFDQNPRTPLGVGQVIQGFSEGLQMIAKTGVIRLCIPAALGYGARESGPIPANSDLVFQVELLDFRTAAEIERMRSERPDEAPAEPEAAPQP